MEIPGQFAAGGTEEAPVLSPANFERYDGFEQGLVKGIGIAGLRHVSIYNDRKFRFKPALETELLDFFVEILRKQKLFFQTGPERCNPMQLQR